jgi:hypothetical protein
LSRWVLSQGVVTLSTRTVAIDGKAASCREVEAVLAQVRVPEVTHEPKTALELLGIIPLKGTLITAAAAFCQRDPCAALVAGQGDYLISVKDNPPTLKQDLATGFARAFSPVERTERRRVDQVAESRSKGHGRVEMRRRRATTRLNASLDWPGIQQACVVERVRIVGRKRAARQRFSSRAWDRSRRMPRPCCSGCGGMGRSRIGCLGCGTSVAVKRPSARAVARPRRSSAPCGIQCWL